MKYIWHEYIKKNLTEYKEKLWLASEQQQQQR